MSIEPQKSYKQEATALFQRIVDRHELQHVVVHAPVEVIWRLPVQSGLSEQVTLCLQNLDELNFGVGPFWSTLFPFHKCADLFETAVDSWIKGDGRIVWRRGWLGGGVLDWQTREGEIWSDVAGYGQLFGVKRIRDIVNDPTFHV